MINVFKFKFIFLMQSVAPNPKSKITDSTVLIPVVHDRNPNP